MSVLLASKFWGCVLIFSIALLHKGALLKAQASPATLSAPAASPTPSLSALDPSLAVPAAPRHTIESWDQALKLLRARSVPLQMALQNVERALASNRIALAAALPTLQLSANAARVGLRTAINPLSGDTALQSFPDHALTYGGNASLAVPLFAPRAWWGVETANVNTEVSRLNVAEQERLQLVALATAIISVVAAERLAEINRSNWEAALSRLALTEKRVALGSGNQLDLARLRQDAAATQATVVTAHESMRTTRESLGILLGYSEPVGVVKTLRLDALEASLRNTCQRFDHIFKRTDVRAQNRTVDQRKRLVTDVDLAFVPTISLTTTFSSIAQPFITTQVGKTIGVHTWSIGALFSWNLFDGGVRYGNRRDALAQLEQAQVQADQTVRSAKIDVLQRLRGVKVAESAYQVAKDTFTYASETDRLSRLAYELGRGTALELVDAARTLREAETRLAIRELEVNQAKVQALLAASSCR